MGYFIILQIVLCMGCHQVNWLYAGDQISKAVPGDRVMAFFSFLGALGYSVSG